MDHVAARAGCTRAGRRRQRCPIRPLQSRPDADGRRLAAHVSAPTRFSHAARERSRARARPPCRRARSSSRRRAMPSPPPPPNSSTLRSAPRRPICSRRRASRPAAPRARRIDLLLVGRHGLPLARERGVARGLGRRAQRGEQLERDLVEARGRPPRAARRRASPRALCSSSSSSSAARSASRARPRRARRGRPETEKGV